MTFQPIDNPDQVDLTCHALVEASAGTGKTYTIENLVVRLLQTEPDLHLENILLVTFTEKATSELKLRIRQKIESTLDGSPDLTEAARRKLGQALDEFDNAAITTIHGFCHTLLKEFPFETGNLFNQEVIDDRPLLENLLKSQMRSHWPEWYGRRLSVLLDWANFSSDPDRFVRTAVALVQRLSPDLEAETLIPDPEGLDFEHLWQACRRIVMAIQPLVTESPGLVAGYGQLNINKKSREAIIRDVVAPLQRAFEGVDEESWNPSEIKAVVDILSARHRSGERHLDRLVPDKWLKAGENLAICPHLVAIRDRLAELVRLINRMAHVLILNAVMHLRQAADAQKGRQGWISYQDMVAHVARFLADKGADDGIQRIRRRYRVAFVDEFQDTDDLQWRIFRTLFLEGHPAAPPNRLFLIGDPKQAIYAFRGADVFTYLDARQCMKNLAEKKMANLYALAVNWRSSPRLVSAFNAVFGHDDWFGGAVEDDPYAIGYAPSDTPPAEQRTFRVHGDRSGRPAFNVVDLTGADRHAVAKSLLAKFICREIQGLVGQGSIRYCVGQGMARALDYGDVAVLVRSRTEFALMEPLFREASIPYTYYRKPGLFQCSEAHWLSMVLHAVARPQRIAAVKLALLTPFFDRCVDELRGLPELPAKHGIMRLLMHWHALGRKRRWGVLFQSLMEHSGMTMRHCTEPSWERTRTNIRQLCDHLENAAYLQNRDIEGVVALLDGLRLARVGAGSDADIHQIEDDAGKVQILTMHVAKGLEFPIAFIAGGLTVPTEKELRVYHTIETQHGERGFRKVIDLTAETGKQAAEKEKEDENKRLYYVALTRARLKLYVPYYPASGNAAWIGPVSRFVSSSIDAVWHGDEDPRRSIGWHRVIEQDPDRPNSINHPERNERTGPQLPAGGLLPEQRDFRNRKVSLESFSSIGHRLGRLQAAGGNPDAFSLLEKQGRDLDEPDEAPLPQAATPEVIDALPGGARMGSMFHHIFETIDFERVMYGPENILEMDAARETIATALALYRIESHWAGEIGHLVANALRMKIELAGTTLELGRLAPKQRRHEIEFYFPMLEALSTGLAVPGCEQEGPCGEMVLRGFIDLVFQWQERFYIADWKSNRLADGYGRDAMAREIAAAGYDLQYRLYTIATLRWLKQQLGSAFDPDRHFGGALYIFIRGAKTGGQKGAFYVDAEQLLPLDHLQRTIQEQIGGILW